MGELQRWDFWADGPAMLTEQTGKYVTFADYAAERAAREEMQRAYDVIAAHDRRMIAACDELNKRAKKAEDERADAECVAIEQRQRADALAAELAALQGRVEALPDRWESDAMGGFENGPEYYSGLGIAAGELRAALAPKPTGQEGG